MFTGLIARLTTFTRKWLRWFTQEEVVWKEQNALYLEETLKENLQIVGRAPPVIEPSWTPAYAASIIQSHLKEQQRANMMLFSLAPAALSHLSKVPLNAWKWDVGRHGYAKFSTHIGNLSITLTRSTLAFEVASDYKYYNISYGPFDELYRTLQYAWSLKRNDA